MIRFRYHAGSLDASMSTVKQFDTPDNLKDFLIDRSTMVMDVMELDYTPLTHSDIEIKLYHDGPDKRIGWEKTYIVMVNGRPIGFCDNDS